jgi:hypothetical protein
VASVCFDIISCRTDDIISSDLRRLSSFGCPCGGARLASEASL